MLAVKYFILGVLLSVTSAICAGSWVQLEASNPVAIMAGVPPVLVVALIILDYLGGGK